MDFVKEKLKYITFFLVLVACLLGFASLQPNLEVTSLKKEIVLEQSLFKAHYALPSQIENQDYKLTRQKENNLFFFLFASLLLSGLISLSGHKTLLFSFSKPCDLSFWGQKIEALSSRAHPPTL